MKDYPETRYLTPYKYGKPVLTGSGIAGRFDCNSVDCPFVFYHRGKYHMMYVGFDGKGYQTALAESGDLLHWSFQAVILKREENAGWDKVGAAGVWLLKESDDLSALPTLKKVDGKYWMFYHAYPGEGYESGPASVGVAWCEDESLLRWHRGEAPVLTASGGAPWEAGGLYKESVIASGGGYYMFYNAKDKAAGWTEQIGVAFSDDLLHWRRFEGNPVLPVSEGKWDSVFASDPYVVRDGGRWIMFYYGYNGRHAQDGIAFSDDLLHWSKSAGPILTNGKAGDLDENHAHKPSVLIRDGTLYHFYCASGRCRPGAPTGIDGHEFRCITVAASRPFPVSK